MNKLFFFVRGVDVFPQPTVEEASSRTTQSLVQRLTAGPHRAVPCHAVRVLRGPATSISWRRVPSLCPLELCSDRSIDLNPRTTPAAANAYVSTSTRSQVALSQQRTFFLVPHGPLRIIFLCAAMERAAGVQIFSKSDWPIIPRFISRTRSTSKRLRHSLPRIPCPHQAVQVCDAPG